MLFVPPSSLSLTCLSLVHSWDTRTPAEPSLKTQAHDREILAVACSPATEHLLITGGADKVRFAPRLLVLITNESSPLHRQLHSTICARRPNVCTHLKRTWTRFFISLGRHITPPYSLPHQATAGLMFGILHRSVWNKPPTTKKTAHRSSCLFMVVRDLIPNICPSFLMMFQLRG
jgi:WD40 repeat protein